MKFKVQQLRPKTRQLKYTCEDCDETFVIVTSSELLPDTCPFCGGSLDNIKYVVPETDDE